MMAIVRNVYKFDCRGYCGRKQVATGNPNQLYCEQAPCQKVKRLRKRLVEKSRKNRVSL